MSTARSDNSEGDNEPAPPNDERRGGDNQPQAESQASAWPHEFEDAILAQGRQLDHYRASDEGRTLIRAIEVLGQEAAEAEGLRRAAELRAAQAGHREKQAGQEAKQAQDRAAASDARADVIARMYDELRAGEAMSEADTQSAERTSEDAGLPSGAVLDLFSEIMGGRKAMSDALHAAAWPQAARLTAPGRGKGRAATWHPRRLAELILDRIEERSGLDAASKARRELSRLFQVDKRLRAWRDEWEATESRPEWLGLDSPNRRTEGKNRG